MVNRKPIYLSTGVFNQNNLAEILVYSSKNELTNLELSSGVEPSADYLSLLLPLRNQYRFLIHNYFPPPLEPFVLNLAATDKYTLQTSRDHCCRAINLCVTVGSPFYSVHSGFAINLTPDLLGQPERQSKLESKLIIKPETAFEIFAESIRFLSEYAETRGVGLLVENNVVTIAHVQEGKETMFLMTKADEIMKLLTEVSNSNLGVLVDVGHLNVSASALKYNPESFISRIKPYIKAFHLSDNDGLADQNCPVSNSSWFWPVVAQFPDATVILEAYNLTPNKISQQTMLLTRKLKG